MSDSDDENFVTFGVPLEPLDEESLPRKKPITIENQVALDEQGRRRFHGAFTGGFSAGYFNTVGTRDGWRPQSFKSSRASKAENVLQRPEDFMDDEDIGEFGIAPKGIRTTSEYFDHGDQNKKRSRVHHNNDGPIPGQPVLGELLKPIKDTFGIMLLKKMGWKPGQGIGPRLTKNQKSKARKRNEKIKVYGCSLPQDKETVLSEDSDNSDIDSDITFAPDDYEPFRCNPKDNYFGIGYSGLDRNPVLSGHVNLFETPAFRLQEKNKKLSIRGQAFGVGAFEADDDDIYAKDDMSRYDFTLGPEKTKTRWSNQSSSSMNCLDGFVPAKNTIQNNIVFPLPELPKDYKPIHTTRKSRFHPPIPLPLFPTRNNKSKVLNANDRARLLDENININQTVEGQKSTSSEGSSVAVNIITRTLNLHGDKQINENVEVQKVQSTNSWKDKLNTQSFIRGELMESDGKFGSLKKLEDFQKENTSDKNFQIKDVKFADSDKQTRFEKYQEFVKDNERDKLKTIQPLSMTDWDREQEQIVFDKTLVMFKTSSNDSPSNIIDVNKKVTEEEVEDKNSLEYQMKQAVKMKMYGKLTRTVTEWKPMSIVCKRFNVPEPLIGCAQPEMGKSSKKLSVFDSLDWTKPSKFVNDSDSSTNRLTESEPISHTEKNDHDHITDNSNMQSEIIPEKIKNFEKTYEKVFGKEITEISGVNIKQVQDNIENKDTNLEVSQDESQFPTQNNEIVESMSNMSKKTLEERKDLFKEIFLSSSEESESEAEENLDNEVLKSVLIGKDPSQLNVQRNLSPPRGIFATLDLDNLIAVPSNDEKSKKDVEISNNDDNRTEPNTGSKKSGETSTNEPILPDIYGPALPSNLSKSRINSDANKSASVSRVEPKVAGQWVEKEKLKKSKKDKHKEKKHKHKDKSKYKYKKSKKDKK